MIAGDFNEPLLGEDKFGGRPVSISRSLLFKYYLNKCNMVDLGFSGPRYTWTNRRDLNNLIQERIDQFFTNPSWCLLYPKARVTHLTRCHSDHCPVLMEAVPKRVTHLNRPFKFQSFWLSDPSFPRVVMRAWSHTRNLSASIEKFTSEATQWNKNQFGNIFEKKRRLMTQLNGIQRSIASNPTSPLIDLENQLQKDLEIVLDQEAELWALKSRVNWMVLGDRNTSFFHVSTLARRKRNMINAIKNDIGDWITEEREVINYFREGFMKLYATSQVKAKWNNDKWTRWQIRLTEEEKNSLDSPISDEEITTALWSLKAFKTPGPDGLHAGFFQRFWLTVGNSVKEEVKQIFLQRKILEYLNNTSIVLIPKIQSPESIGSYQPISLCNSVYKVITKIIVGMLRPYLDKLIAPCQATFVPRRRGVDNAIIVQEIIHSMEKTKGRGGYMALKIDLEKTYDKLEWSFIRDTLLRFNLPKNLVELIMSCVSSVSTSILFNGRALDTFKPTRGIRQGNPLSPYIFIMCMDYLGQLIQEKCAANSWNLVKASRSGPAFSHLFFADDLVLFAKANPKNCVTIRGVLDDFCSQSGQTISEAKSKVFFSPNLDKDHRDALGDILGFQSTPNLGRYLHFPLKHRGASNQDFNFVLEKVKKKLAGWKANLLSMARRAVLIQASTSAIPAYVMQNNLLPGRILDGIDRMNRNFL